MIEAIKKNIETEIEMLREISVYSRRIEFSKGIEKAQLEGAITSLRESMRIINDSIPELLKEVEHENKLPGSKKKEKFEEIEIKRAGGEIRVNLSAKSKEKFLKELSISENLIKKIKGQIFEEKEKFQEFKAARGYLKLSNRLFLDKSSEMIKKGYFRALYNEIKKANLDILFETYVAMMLFTTLLSVFAGIMVFVLLIFFNIQIGWPILQFYDGSYLIRMAKLLWVPFAVPIVTFFAIYFYPTTERKSISKRIDGELPFAVIHMSAISGSGISPTEIFKIIGLSKEYPFLRREIRKILNQTNIYGYDLVTALGNVSRSTPSQKLSELFNGISTNINSGGDLSDFFEKRAETLLEGYRLEREKFTKVAETFMDIYISVVIATPMILMLLLVMISLTGIQTGFSPSMLSILIVFVVALVNVLFLGFLQIKQPAY